MVSLLLHLRHYGEFITPDNTPQKPPSDSELLQKFMVWKLIRIYFEVTSEVFKKIWCMIKFLSGWYFMMNEVPSNKQFGHTPQISKNFRSGSISIRKNFEIPWWLLWCRQYWLLVMFPFEIPESTHIFGVKSFTVG